MYASLLILGRQDWIDGPALAGFILQAVDDDTGGIADRPGDQADLFHTLFGVAAYSFVGGDDAKGLKSVDPRFCMTHEVTKRILI